MAQLKTFNKFGELLDDRQILDTFEDHLLLSCGHEEGQPYWFTATLNGHPWTSYTQALVNSDVIEVNIEPKWPAVPYIIAAVSAAYSYYVAKGIDRPVQDYQQSLETGKSIYSASARANSIRPSGSIREVSGEITIFPEYIIPPYRRYIGNDEVLFIMMSVGGGHFDLERANITIAETPLNRYIGQFGIDIFEPGDDVTQADASEYWYQTKEVAGLRLTTDVEEQFGEWTADFSGDQITSYFEGTATAFPFLVNASFEIFDGSNAGKYRVVSVFGADLETAIVVDVTLVQAELDRLSNLNENQNINPGFVTPTYDRELLEQNGSTPSFTVVVGANVTWQAQNAGIRWFGPYVLTPDNELSNQFEIDLKFPLGLGKRNDTTGLMELYTVGLSVQYRNFGDVEWISVPRFTWTESTRDQQGRTIRITTDTKIRPEIRFRRTTQDAEEDSIYDVAEIVGIKTKLDIQSSYPEITTIALRVVSDEGFTRESESQINIRGARRKLPTLAEIQALTWDLSDAATKSGDFYSLADTTYLGSASKTKFIKGTPIPYTDPCVDINNDGDLMLVTLGRRYYQMLTLYELFNVETTRTTSYPPQEIDVTLPFSGFADTIARFGNDTHNKFLVLVHHTSATVSKLIVWNRYQKAINTEWPFTLTGVIDVYSAGDGLRFLVLRDTGFINIHTYGTAWDLTTEVSAFNVLDFNSVVSGKSVKSISYSADGLKAFVLASGDIHEFSVNFPFSGAHTLVATRTQFQTNNPLYISASPERLYFSERESNTQINQYQLNVFNDTRATRSAVRFCAYILWQAMGDKVVDQVDWVAMDALDVLLESRGDNLDAEFVDETTLWEVLRSALLVGYAEPTIKNGLFTPIRVSAGTDFKQLYTPDIMIGELQYDQPFYDGQDADGVEVEYFDTLNNQTNTIIVNDGVDQGLRPSRVQAIGITDREKAFRFGMRQYNRERYRPARITFTTEMDALNSEYGDAIAIGSSLWGSQFGEIMNYNDILAIATLSFIPQFAVGDHFLSLRDKEGSTEIYQCTAVGGQPFQVELASNPTFDPVFAETIDSTFVTFGTTDEVFKRAIVRKIEPQDETTVQVTAEEYLELVYQSDNATLGAAPWIVPDQILNYSEFRVDGDAVGFVDIGGQYTPEDVTFAFGNGTQLSDDGFFTIGNGAVDAGIIKFTAAGAASTARNDFDVLPNFSFYSVKATAAGEDSDITTITLKILESLLPPADSLAYWSLDVPQESTSDPSADFYQNFDFSKSYRLTVDESPIVEIDGLSQFGFAVEGFGAPLGLGLPLGDLMPDSFKEATQGTSWFVIKTRAGFDVDSGFRVDKGGSGIENLRITVTESASKISLALDVDLNIDTGTPLHLNITYDAVGAMTDYMLIALTSDGTDYTAYTSVDGIMSETTAVGDAVLRGVWNADMVTSAGNSGYLFDYKSDGGLATGSLIVASGYTSKPMSLNQLDRLAEIALEPDT